VPSRYRGLPPGLPRRKASLPSRPGTGPGRPGRSWPPWYSTAAGWPSGPGQAAKPVRRPGQAVDRDHAHGRAPRAAFRRVSARPPWTLPKPFLCRPGPPAGSTAADRPQPPIEAPARRRTSPRRRRPSATLPAAARDSRWRWPGRTSCPVWAGLAGESPNRDPPFAATSSRLFVIAAPDPVARFRSAVCRAGRPRSPRQTRWRCPLRSRPRAPVTPTRATELRASQRHGYPTSPGCARRRNPPVPSYTRADHVDADLIEGGRRGR